MHLFISVASLLCMEVNFLNQNPCMPWNPGFFQFAIFLSVALSPLGCMFTWPSSSTHNSVSLLYIHLAFLLWSFRFHVCSSVFLFLSHPVVDMASPILPQLLVVFLFIYFFCCCFGTSCFVYIVWPCLDIFLVFLFWLVFFGWSPHPFFEFSLLCFFSFV